ncbi:MAG: GNAT family N-acetyltransferase [Rhizobiaceae bacterium]|nr:GNAT family N-acetyltransferase [Rhizobiaceae bacterium]
MSTLLLDIRRARPGDGEQIANAHDASWRQAYCGIVPHRALDRMVRRRGEEWWERAISRSTVILVAEIDDTIAGYATLGINRIRSLAPDGEIYEIYLRPEYQGVGLGTGLFLDARIELKRRRLKGTAVWVLADNEPAIRFYENAGGRAIAEGFEQFDGEKLLKIAYGWD